MRQNRKITKIFIFLMGLMFLIFAFGPISQAKENKIHFSNQHYFFQRDDYDPPIPGDMEQPYLNFNGKDFSQEKLVPSKIFSHFTCDVVIDMIEAMDESLILGYLESLTAFGPRVTGTTECYDAGDYIYNEFESMGLEVRFHNWSYHGYTDRNIEATIQGTDEESDEIYIICAHFDSVPGSPGADDDGSGVVAVMASAFIMKDYTFNHTIRFVTFSGEEQGLLGSHEYAEEAYNNNDNIIAVLNVDMIGYALTTEQGNRIKVYFNTASQWLINYTNDVSKQYYEYIELDVIPSGYTWGSDHYYFWENGYDALFYHEYKFNDYYHSSQDTIKNMNLTYSTKCSKLIIATLADLALPCDIIERPFPEIQSINGGLFKVSSAIKNIGLLDAKNVNWTITFDGGAFIGKETEGSILNIPVGENVPIKSKFVLGFGPTQVTIRVWMTDGPSDIKDQVGYVLFFLIKI